MRRNKIWLTYAAVLILVILFNFLLPRFLPGGPVEYMAGGENASLFMSEEQKAVVLSYYHLNEPLWRQFVDYLYGVMTLNFGMSLTYKTSALAVVWSRLPWTLLIVGVSTLLSIAAGLLAGLYSAWKQRQGGGQPLFLTMLAVSAIPEFLLGLVFLIIFSIKLHWFPIGGAVTAFADQTRRLDEALDVLRHAALPILTLTVANISGLYLLARSEAGAALRQPFIEFAEAKGIGRGKLVFRHVLRNAILPMFTMIVIRIGGMLAGAVLVETVFSYPGAGKLLQEAILNRDYPLMHALFFIITVTALLLNMIADFLYSKLDPRIRNREGA